MSELRRWGDEHQYDAAPMQANYSEERGVLPRVELLSMSTDPLGEIAAASMMYEGKVVYDLSEITDEQREHYWQQAQATHLKAPLEYVHFHFLLEGVDRAFTHQHVRQRTAVYSQESLRFAVVDNLREGTSLPPSLHGTRPMEEEDLPDQRQSWRNAWDDTLVQIQNAYEYLVNSGMPAEEARGLLPHATATRIHYDTNLRNILDHAGNRLCTQAQYHWKLVFAQIAQQIRRYGHVGMEQNSNRADNAWQYEKLASIFKPVCYEMGKCPFNASYDRSCSIRERVQTFAEHGVPSSEWHEDHEVYVVNGARVMQRADEPSVPDHYGDAEMIPGIRTEEWALDPTAARRGRR